MDLTLVAALSNLVCSDGRLDNREYQGRGIGRALMRHLATIARATGLQTLIAEVLPENTQMLQLFKTSGLRLSTKREAQVVHVTLIIRLF
jgi:GNAT superfamily N-acetyltransferase